MIEQEKAFLMAHTIQSHRTEKVLKKCFAPTIERAENVSFLRYI